MTIIKITSASQLPRWLLEPLPGETPEQAAARIRAKFGAEPKAYQLGSRVFFEHPRAAQ